MALLLACAFASPSLASVGLKSLAGDERANLSRMRAARRAASRAASTGAKEAGGRPSGLLVIPVDFADARLPVGWDPTSLSSRLTADSGESLRQYFTMASDGRLDLRITLAPLVRLTGTRRDYSDRDLNGFTRTRRLATEALQAVRDLGLEFRRLDMDGPDRIPGTDDDDGEIDGVLILHAAPGEENDPENGFIQPLQFYLDEPVISDGIAATFYAVASMHSGPGIWAHETAHLLGLEDRYDPLLPSVGGEVASRGGLGRFSLMASGAWGTGDGWGAALPDGYSRLQMGWTQHPTGDLVPPRGNNAPTGPGYVVYRDVVVFWPQVDPGTEFFLAEIRDPAASAPFDAAVPGGDLVLYHVDEAVAEGGWAEEGAGQYHLRVRLVEADDDRALEEGRDNGRAEDLWPGPLGQDEFGPQTLPSSLGYGGPTGVHLAGIQRAPGGIVYTRLDSPPDPLRLSYSFRGLNSLSVGAVEWEPVLTELQAEVAVAGTPSWGTFQGGLSQVTLTLSPFGEGRWLFEGDPVLWELDPAAPAGASTEFTIRFTGNGYDSGLIPWTWVWGTGGPLDFATDWPGEWVIDHPDGNIGTTWFRWDAAPFLTADGTPVLACVDARYPTSSDWPAVTYGNNAHTTLTSGPLGSEVPAVRIVHAVEVETLAAEEVMDGALVEWIDRNGDVWPALWAAGYPARIAPQSANPRHGDTVFRGPPLELTGDQPLWRTDLFKVPQKGTGPYRLRFVFASNPLWRFRGWFIASIEPLTTFFSPRFLPVMSEWTGDLEWEWPFGTGAQDFTVEFREEDRTGWNHLWSGNVVPVDGTYTLDGGLVLAGLPGRARTRHEVRVTGTMAKGLVGSRPAVVYPDGGDGQTILLAQPWPNPGRAPIRFQIDVPVARAGKVSIFDVRGRLVRRLEFPAGSHLGIWDGKDSGGRLLPSGAYFLRLEGSGPVTTRKVVLLH